MTDFDFTSDAQSYSPTQEDTLRGLMMQQYDEDDKLLKLQGRWPDWKGEPEPLSADKERLLTYLYDNGYVQWDSNPSTNNAAVTKAIGLNNVPNARAVIAICKREGLVEARIYRNRQVYQMTQMGEFYLNEHLIEKEVLGL